MARDCRYSVGTWYPAATFSADSITFDVLAPKPKGWAKKASAPCVATVTITAEQLADILAGDSLIIDSGNCTFTITQKVNGANVGIEVKVILSIREFVDGKKVNNNE